MSQQQLAVAPPKIAAGGQVAALIPQNLDEAFRVAKAFSVSGLAPQSLKTPEAVLVSIMAGAELGFAPYQAMQSFAVINGRASIWGDAIPALLWARGFDIEEWFDDDDNATKAFCKVTRPSGKTIERTFSLKDAKAANLLGKQGPWQTAQKRMLQMRARAFAARDGAADVLRGMPVYEEVQDYQPIHDVTPRASGLRERLEARQGEPEQGFTTAQGTLRTACEVCGAASGVECADSCSSWDDFDPAGWPESVRRHRAAREQADAETGEIVDAEVEQPTDDFPGDKPVNGFDVLAWADDLERNLPDYAGVDVLRGDWNDHKADLQAASPERFKDLNYKIAQRAKEIAEKAAHDEGQV